MSNFKPYGRFIHMTHANVDLTSFVNSTLYVIELNRNILFADGTKITAIMTFIDHRNIVHLRRFKLDAVNYCHIQCE